MVKAYTHNDIDKQVILPVFFPENAVCLLDMLHLYFRTSFQRKHIEPRHEISNNVVCATSKASDQPARMRSLIRAFASQLHILCVLSY